jgi:hypothetical protein
MEETGSDLGDLEQSMIVEDDDEVGEVEKPKKVKKPLTDYQKANLEKGRLVRKQRGEEKRKAEAEALEKAVAEKAAKEKVKITKKADKIVGSLKVAEEQQPMKTSIPKLRRKQVIVLQSDTESDEDQIIIRRSKKKEKQPPSPPPPEQEYEEPEAYEEPSPEPTFRRLKRV